MRNEKLRQCKFVCLCVCVCTVQGLKTALAAHLFISSKNLELRCCQMKSKYVQSFALVSNKKKHREQHCFGMFIYFRQLVTFQNGLNGENMYLKHGRNVEHNKYLCEF